MVFCDVGTKRKSSLYWRWQRLGRKHRLLTHVTSSDWFTGGGSMVNGWGQRFLSSRRTGEL